MVSFLLFAVMLWRMLSGQKLSRKSLALKHNGPVVWGVAVCVGVGMRFCKVPVSWQDFRVTI